jgi:hypothetical protein
MTATVFESDLTGRKAGRKISAAATAFCRDIDDAFSAHAQAPMVRRLMI